MEKNIKRKSKFGFARTPRSICALGVKCGYGETSAGGLLGGTLGGANITFPATYTHTDTNTQTELKLLDILSQSEKTSRLIKATEVPLCIIYGHIGAEYIYMYIYIRLSVRIVYDSGGIIAKIFSRHKKKNLPFESTMYFRACFCYVLNSLRY